MRRGLCALMTVGAVTALGATPAAASLTPVPDGQGSAQNVSTITQAPNAASGGDAAATGGNGGDAGTGNTQVLNGNSVSVGLGPKAQAESQGGDTSAKSGDANGGDGGDAKASGGDATAGNVAAVKQVSSLKDGQGSCGCSSKRSSDDPSTGDSSERSSEAPSEGSSGNHSTVEQDPNAASGGKGTATGGNGGDANTGNEQALNGNSVGVAAGPKAKAASQGGDTSAKSGDANGGDGGNAKASGGDATAGNVAAVKQVTKGAPKQDSSDERLACGCPVKKPAQDPGNLSWVKQGENAATGGEATATGGDGGYADTGNVQKGNGNAWAWTESKDGLEAERCGCDRRRDDNGGAFAEGGDTKASSGDADGGDGGDARAVGGDAVAGNIAKVLQRTGRE